MHRFLLSKPNGCEGKVGLRLPGFNWGNTSLSMFYNTYKGYIKTKKGNLVEVWRQPNKKIVFELINTETKEKIFKPKNFFEQFKPHFDISYNCYGYCFANSKFWIYDPSVFIEDEYEFTTEKKAEIIMFREISGCDSYGFSTYDYVHAVKVIDSKLISFKPGIGSLVENVHKKFSNHLYNFNNKIYLRKKI
jgi:hypothetical protein